MNDFDQPVAERLVSLTGRFLGFVEQREVGDASVHYAFDALPLAQAAPGGLCGHAGCTVCFPSGMTVVWVEVKGREGLLPGLERPPEEGGWVTFEASPDAPLAAEFSRGLDGPMVPGGVGRFSASLSGDERAMARKYSLDADPVVPAATTAFIAGLLPRGAPQMVCAYNVGQGSANALCDGNAVPLVYFDVGGGCGRNGHTYPRGVTFCTSKASGIVLSHWDWDHWYQASVDARLRRLPWLAPVQTVGPLTRQFTLTLPQLRIWSGTGPIPWALPQTTIEQCLGSSKNDSGFALAVQLGAGRRSRVLLPGDAEYRYVPAARFQQGALVATHHGTAHHGPLIPSATGAHRVLAYSYGRKNTYRHAKASSRTAHRRHGWNRALNTPKGHIALRGQPGPPPIGCRAANCRCTLRPVQW